MAKKLLILFIYFSFITKSIGGIESSNPILSRLTFADIFGALALVFGVQYLFNGLIKANKTTKLYIIGLWFVVLLFILMPFSLNIGSTLVESLILLFLMFVSILIFYLLKDKLMQTLLPTVINTTIIAAFLGFYDIAASIVGLPRLFDARNDGEVISGFRNAGQAGAYFLVFLSLLIPLYYSDLKQQLSNRYQKRLGISIIISLVFLISTGKIAAYIGLLIGVVLFLLQQRKFKLLVNSSIVFIIMYIGFLNLGSIAPALNKRINYKIEARIVQNYEGTSTNNFFESNYGAAINAFFDSPLTGSGIGGFTGNYGRYEIHSTYLKMLGEGGIFVTILYIILMAVFLKLFKNIYTPNNPYGNYLRLMIPFVIGCLVSWSYTYHLRKREFWIMVAVIVIVSYSAQVWKNNKVRNIEE
ncbi:MAG: O-antigen ligase family protein [Flavobacteriaceae bacterium]|nr:O-antigen ligase family protein [Flavobacteriaceae bacterium]